MNEYQYTCRACARPSAATTCSDTSCGGVCDPCGLTDPKHRRVTCLAIIGTAGRKEDEARLTHNHWLTMVKAGIDLFLGEKFDMLVSGGAAWADHVAVQMTDYEIYGYGTEIWLPANERDLDIARWYHSKFSKVVGFDTREQINRCYREGKLTIQKHGGFKDRNTKVAEIASHFLAFTFGDGPKVKDGGTADTVRKMQNRGVTGWHYDLNTLTLHKIP